MGNDYYYVRTISGIDFLMLDSGEDKPDSDFEYNEIADFDNYRVKEAEWIAPLRNRKNRQKTIDCIQPHSLF